MGQKCLAYYEFFFTQGTPKILGSVFHLVSGRLGETRESSFERDDQSLANLVRGLVALDVIPNDILRQTSWDGPDEE